MNAKRLSIRTMADAAAAAISALGYTPTESVVVSLMYRQDERIIGGPIARVEAPTDQFEARHVGRGMAELIQDANYTVAHAFVGVISDHHDVLSHAHIIGAELAEHVESGPDLWTISAGRFTDIAGGAEPESVEVVFTSPLALNMSMTRTEQGINLQETPQLPAYISSRDATDGERQKIRALGISALVELWGTLTSNPEDDTTAHLLAHVLMTKPGAIEILACAIIDPENVSQESTFAQVFGLAEEYPPLEKIDNARQLITERVSIHTPNNQRGPLIQLLVWCEWICAHANRAHKLAETLTTTTNATSGPLATLVATLHQPRYVNNTPKK